MGDIRRFPRPVTRREQLLGEWFAFLERERRDYESLIEASKRVLIEHAMAETDKQKDAGKLLGMTQSSISHHIRHYGQRYRLRRLGWKEI
jgi:hypothetical protein